MFRLSTTLTCLLAAPLVSAADIHVPAEHATISEAITAASDGDTIHVSPGTYRERLDTGGKAITITGVDGAESTVVDGQGPARGSTLTCDSKESAATRLINLTFTGGKGQMNMDYAEIMGGGVLVKDCSPIFIGCIFTGNNAQYGSGGGIAVTGGSPVFIDCTIQANRSDSIAGGVLIMNTDATFIRCGFVKNASPCGGGVYIWHDGMPTFESCTFTDNSALLSGGGIFNWYAAPILNQCRFEGNASPYGSAICNLSGAPSLINTKLEHDQELRDAQPHPLQRDPEPAPPLQ